MKIKRNGKIIDLTECPFCNYDEYHVIITYSGRGCCNYKYDPGKLEFVDNTELHTGVTYKEQKAMYCSNCGKKIGYKIDE